VKATYYTIDYSYDRISRLNTAGDDSYWLDEETKALSMTVEEMNIMKRWAQAAKDKRQEGAQDEAVIYLTSSPQARRELSAVNAHVTRMAQPPSSYITG
jgi:hypothetical protein